ncbi:MAG: hypothetical protein K5761_00645 [Clostridiales bacterium]|nr:hypothetical protein [Clostridiales bacterium]
MKRILKGIISSLLVLVFTCAQFQVFAVSDGNDLVFDPSLAKEYTVRHIPVDDCDGTVTAKLFNSSGSADQSSSSTFLFYNQLNSYEKEIYNAGYKAKISENIHVSFSKTLTYTTSSVFGELALVNYLNGEISGALSALMDDHPDFFWINGYTISDYTGSYSVDSNKYTYYVEKLDFTVSLNTDAHPSFAQVKTAYNDLMQDIEDFPVEGFTRYEKVKSIHDNICNMASYDPNYNNSNATPTIYEPISVFNEPHLTVCEGYSEAFKLICDREGIPCLVVVGNGGGGPHAWNYVQMEDGRWYVIDITWNDQEDVRCYDFFLIGSSTVNALFDLSPYTSSHVEDGMRFMNTSFRLSYPALSFASYSGALKYMGSSSTEDNSNMRIYIPKDADLQNQFFTPLNSILHDASGKEVNSMPTDYRITVKGLSTGATVKITNLKKSESRKYTVSRWGDINSDNQVDNTDYDMILNAASGHSEIQNQAQFDAADFNHDGVIDGFDANYMELYLNGEVSK